MHSQPHINIKKKNVEIIQVLVIPAILYGYKTWIVQKKHEGRLRDSRENFFEISCGIYIIWL